MARLSIPDEDTFADFDVETSTSVFPITFSLFAKADLTVLIDGMALSQSAFSFSGTLLEGGGYAGGTVTLNAAVTGVTVRIERNVQPIRASQFAPSNSVPVGSIDQAFNRIVATQQDQARSKVTRPSGDRAGKFLAFDAEGNETPSVGTGADAGLRTDLASSTGGSLIAYLAAGTGAKVRTQRDKSRDGICVFDFDGVVGDGVNDDAPGLRAAIAAASGRELYWRAPPVRFRCASSLGELAYTRFRGDGRRYVQIRKDYSGGDPLLTLMDSAEVIGLQFDGQGATRTGRTLLVPNGQGNQILRDVSLINGRDNCIYFEKDGGSRFTADNVQASCFDLTKPAIEIEDTDTGGTPRRFCGLETDGSKSFKTGGANNLYVSDSSLFDIDFSPNSHDVTIINSRMAGLSGYLLKGSGAIIGGAIGPDVTCDVGSTWTVIPGYTNSEIFDNSGGTCVIVQHKAQEYDPVLKAGGVAVTLGTGGSYEGRYSRSGKLVTVKIRVVWGTGATIPYGAMTITLPTGTSSDIPQTCVNGEIQPTSGTVFPIMGTIDVEASEAALKVLASGAISPLDNATPSSLGDGTGMSLMFSYEA